MSKNSFFSEFGTYNAIFLYKFWILCNFAGVTHSTIACLVVTDWKYTYISFLRTWTLSFKNYSQTHLASRVEDCHLWLYREKETLSVANPTERKKAVVQKDFKHKFPNVEKLYQNWYPNQDWKILQQRTYPPSVSIQLVDAWAPKTLPSVSYAVVIRDEDFLLQTLMTRMVGPL